MNKSQKERFEKACHIMSDAHYEMEQAGFEYDDQLKRLPKDSQKYQELAEEDELMNDFTERLYEIQISLEELLDMEEEKKPLLKVLR